MKRWFWLSLAAVIVIGVGVTLVALPGESEWTTESPEALAAFEDGMDAMMKLYWPDAYEDFRRAAELDPDFAVAKLMWADLGRALHREDVEVDELVDEVLAVDTSNLTQRERFFIDSARARHEERRDDIPKIVDDYLARNPNDPYVLNEKAQRAFSTGEWEEAERLYQRLVEIAPNWVIAYNQLGYINMSEGRFAEAEEYFKSYRFIAPDQANPYDSLGELFVTLGRYDEAEKSFEKAIEIKPDFWAAYEHIVLMKSVSGDLAGARDAIDRATEMGMPEEYAMALDCHAQYMALHNSGSWREILALSETSECVSEESLRFTTTMTHLAACKVGDWETALEIERAAENLLTMNDEKMGSRRGIAILQAGIDHLKGVRLALQGEYGDAKELLRAADERVSYVEANSAIFKLYNRMILAELLLADGQDADAHSLLSSIRGVNPVWVAEFEDTGLKMIGLERG